MPPNPLPLTPPPTAPSQTPTPTPSQAREYYRGDPGHRPDDEISRALGAKPQSVYSGTSVTTLRSLPHSLPAGPNGSRGADAGPGTGAAHERGGVAVVYAYWAAGAPPASFDMAAFRAPHADASAAPAVLEGARGAGSGGGKGSGAAHTAGAALDLSL
jgi:hypothetical protein